MGTITAYLQETKSNRNFAIATFKENQNPPSLGDLFALDDSISGLNTFYCKHNLLSADGITQLWNYES